MSDIVIRVENLSKKYVIGHEGRSNSDGGLRHALQDAVSAPFKRLRRRPLTSLDIPASASILNSSAKTEDFYALRDVSFEVKRGEVLGIIGRNGAGKSTLLKILSRITEPTSGRIGLKGRVASLLEVGTGFHPELSGRENIYLNGAILGMTRAEVRAAFDEIVAFSEVEKFLDTPVKRYSSGMYVRLAFAVAAHLEPDILIVDEVLAVGDQRFQQKCLGKMEVVSSQGRTVIFVSHSMPVINRLCQNTLLLAGGTVAQIGCSGLVTSRYLAGDSQSCGSEWVASDTQCGRGSRLLRIRLCDESGVTKATFDNSRSIHCRMEYELESSDRGIIPALHLLNDQGAVVFASAGFSLRDQIKNGGEISSICIIPAHLLAEGHYSFLFALVSYNPDIVHVLERDTVSMLITDQYTGDGARGDAAGSWPGLVRPKLEWRIG